MSPSAYGIRPGTREDLSRLPAIEVAAGRLFPPGRIPDPNGHLPEADLEAAQRSGGLFVVVPVAGSGAVPGDSEGDELSAKDRCGHPVGFAVCAVTGTALHLVELSVHPDHGRRGLGRRLLKRVIEEAAARSLEAVKLTTFSDIPWNAPFYASMGFEVVPAQALPPALAAALEHESASGLTERVAMRLAVAEPEPGRTRL